jgi:predicted hydrocarbon binding protein
MDYFSGRVLRFNGVNVIAKGSFEASESEEATCHRLRGIIYAVLERGTEKRIICIEEKCLSMGDPYCEFILRGMEELND